MQVCPGVAGRPFELGKRLLLHGDDGDVVTEAARALEHEEGKPAVAGNQTDAGHWKSKRLIRIGQPGPTAKSIIGLGEEMLRRIACGILLCAIGRAGGLLRRRRPRARHRHRRRSPRRSTGTREPGGAARPTRSSRSRAGPIMATLTAVGPDADQERRLQPRHVQLDAEHLHRRASTTPRRSRPSSSRPSPRPTGDYCVRVYDNGNVTTDAVAVHLHGHGRSPAVRASRRFSAPTAIPSDAQVSTFTKRSN